MPDIWALSSILVKTLLYMGILGATGTVLVQLVFSDLLHPMRRLLLRRSLLFGFLGVVTTALGFILRGGALTGDASGLFDREMLGLLWQTRVGDALVLRALGLTLLLVGVAVPRAGLWLAAVGGLIAISSFAQIGHIPEQGGIVLQTGLVLHLVGVAFWIGILTPLAHMTSIPSLHGSAADLGHRFGPIASISVPLLIAVGLLMAWTLLGGIAPLLTSAYGQTVLLKIVAVAGLLGLAAANKLRYVPALRAGDPRAARHLARVIRLEWIVLVMVFAITATLTSILMLPG